MKQRESAAAPAAKPAAYAIAANVFADTTRRQQLGLCRPTSAQDGCVRTFFETFLESAFRRPVSASEVEAQLGLVDSLEKTLGDSDRAFQYGLAAVLQSPDFLYRAELGEPDPANPIRLRYTSMEMASRLSFAIGDGLPDAELRAAAKRGDLVTPQAVRAQAERMLSSQGTDGPLLHYLETHLEVDQIESLPRAPSAFPTWTKQLAIESQREASRLLGSLLEPGRDFRDVFRAPSGLTEPPLPAGAQRLGLLGTVAWLARHSHADAPSPMARGHAVRKAFFCLKLEFPDTLEALMALQRQEQAAKPVATPTLTLARAESNARLASPTCGGCHKLMDPIGLSLENFDAIGAYRSSDGSAPIDASSELDGTPFTGLPGLAVLLANTPAAMDCVARELYAHLVGHEPTAAEEPLVSGLQASFGKVDYSLPRFAVHGGGGKAESSAVIAAAARGYAMLAINWLGNAVDNSQPGDPNTDWGAVDPTQANQPGYFGTSPGPKTIDAVESPRNSNWFLLSVAALRSITFLERQPEVDPPRLGATGHSMGGKIVTDLAALDSRLKVVVASCGGAGNELADHHVSPNALFDATIDNDAYLPLIGIPFLFMVPSNDFNAKIDDLDRSWPRLPTTKRLSTSPNLNHQHLPEALLASSLWEDRYLKQAAPLPETPSLTVTVADNGASFVATPDAGVAPSAVEVWYSTDPPPGDTRHWLLAPAAKGDHGWTATIAVANPSALLGYATRLSSVAQSMRVSPMMAPLAAGEIAIAACPRTPRAAAPPLSTDVDATGVRRCSNRGRLPTLHGKLGPRPFRKRASSRARGPRHGDAKPSAERRRRGNGRADDAAAG